jgi:hypothetical protein
MRSYHVIAVGVFLAVGFAVAVLLSPAVKAHLTRIMQRGLADVAQIIDLA